MIPVLIAVVALIAVLLAPEASAGAPRTDVCHQRANGTWKVKSLPTRGKAIRAHLRHGDGLPGREVPGATGLSFDENCRPVSNHLLILQSEAPFTANPYLALSTADALVASLVVEPFADIAPDGTLVPVLAEMIPTTANGGISGDRTQITWTLREGVLWSDGTSFTAADAVATWDLWRLCPVDAGLPFGIEFCEGNPAFAGVTDVQALDPQTVQISFAGPTTDPLVPFVGYVSPVLQGAQFAPCVGVDPFDCPQHFMPLGTGPFVITEFVFQNSAQYEASMTYRGTEAGLPFFRTVDIESGVPETIARAVLEDGEADYAWDLALPPELLETIVAGGQGEVISSFASAVEHINLNQTDPDGVPPSGYDNGANPNPFFFENVVLHDAMSMAIDRTELVELAYGFSGQPTCNMWILASQTSSTNDSCLTQDIAGANALLDANGYLDTDEDGVRETPAGDPLEFEFVTSTNAVRQAVQALIQGYWDQIGIATNMQDQPATAFFAPGTGASIWEFFTDITMFTNAPVTPEASSYLSGWTIDEMPDPVTNPMGNNFPRLASAQYEVLITQLQAMPLDDPGRDALIIQLNDILVDYAVIPLVHRGVPSAVANDIVGASDPSGWDSEYSSIETWTRTSTP